MVIKSNARWNLKYCRKFTHLPIQAQEKCNLTNILRFDHWSGFGAFCLFIQLPEAKIKTNCIRIQIRQILALLCKSVFKHSLEKSKHDERPLWTSQNYFFSPRLYLMVEAGTTEMMNQVKYFINMIQLIQECVDPLNARHEKDKMAKLSLYIICLKLIFHIYPS